MKATQNESNEQHVAQQALVHLTHALASQRAGHLTFEMTDMHAPLTLPRKALELLTLILSNMAAGHAVSLLPAEAEVSTQEAADLLHVSRPHLVKLLETGTIPFKKVGSHRRVLLADVLRYEAQQQAQRTQQLQFLADQAQELHFGYE